MSRDCHMKIYSKTTIRTELFFYFDFILVVLETLTRVVSRDGHKPYKMRVRMSMQN